MISLPGQHQPTECRRPLEGNSEHEDNQEGRKADTTYRSGLPKLATNNPINSLLEP